MLLLVFVLLLTSILAYFKIADHYNIIDKPNRRSSHKHITLRGGGIVIYIGAVLYFLFYGFKYPVFFFGLSIIAIISLIDDIKTMPSKVRIVFHFTAILLMFYDCGLYTLPWYLSLGALVVTTGIINAYNFMDGINGITGGYSLIVMASYLYINNYIVPIIDNNFIYVIILSLLVFNFFNFRKRAKCFAGDVGAISIAFIIVFLLGKLIVQTNILTYIIILLVYGLDTVLTIVHRLMLKENIFEAHRKHMYQIMSNELQIPHIYVSIIYMTVQSVVMVGYFSLDAFVGHNSYIEWTYLFVSTLVLGSIYIHFMRKYFKLHQKFRNP
ncbi:MAG: glycosyltransferase family 4 protein [Bacteroidales bacterium]